MKFLDFLRRVIASGYDEGRNEDQPLNMRSTHVERIVAGALNELKSGSVVIDETQWDNAKLKAENAELQARLKAADARVEAATSPVPGLAESGPYTLADVELIEQHRGRPYARLRETVLALDAARRVIDELEADAARLREALAEIARPKRGGIEANDSDEEWFEYLRDALERERATARAALAATDSTEWLAKHDEEVRAKLVAKLKELEAKAPREPFDVRCADALADEVAVLVRRQIIDARSPAADALMDYRNPPPTERSDALWRARERLAAAEAERDAAKADAARLREALENLLEEVSHDVVMEFDDGDIDMLTFISNALSATDSAEWLEKHDAEVARRVRDEVVRLFRVAYDGPCVRGEKIVASRTVDQLLRGVE